ncbi:MAG: DUF4124 domain-containing protein [Betaproteobacteria bacterium]|nr:DUF4124 domain-containing protein [Betaproteobacteria bacterium]
MDAHALPPRRTPRRAAGAALALLVVLCAMSGPAAAQMYKWVDDRVQTHYSNTPPAGAKAPANLKKLENVDERLTVYTPEPALTRPPEPATRKQKRDAESDRRDAARSEARLKETERELEAERRARTELEAARRAQNEAVALPYYYAPPLPLNKRRAPNAPPYDPAKFYGADASAPVGVNNAPPVGVNNAPRIGVNNAPPAGKPSHSADGYRR